MANSAIGEEIDWMACELIEAIPGKVSGQPVVRGIRVMPDAIVDSYNLGETIEEPREGFPSLSVEQITQLIEFAIFCADSPVCEGAARRKPRPT